MKLEFSPDSSISLDGSENAIINNKKFSLADKLKQRQNELLLEISNLKASDASIVDHWLNFDKKTTFKIKQNSGKISPKLSMSACSIDHSTISCHTEELPVLKPFDNSDSDKYDSEFVPSKDSDLPIDFI